MKYQLQYKANSKTHTVNLELLKEENVHVFFDDIFDGELTEARKFVFERSSNKKDDGNYIKYYSALMLSDNGASISVNIPKIKKGLSFDSFQNILKSYIKIGSKKPSFIKISSKY